MGECGGERVGAGELEAQARPSIGTEGGTAVERDRRSDDAVTVIERPIYPTRHATARGSRDPFLDERVDVELGAVLEARPPGARGAAGTSAGGPAPGGAAAGPRPHGPLEDADVAAPIAAREAVPLVVGNADAAVRAVDSGSHSSRRSGGGRFGLRAPSVPPTGIP